MIEMRGFVRFDGAPVDACWLGLATDRPAGAVSFSARSAAGDGAAPAAVHEEPGYRVVADARLFEGAGDSEVPRRLLAAYRRHGVECARHVRGEFAFAVWDEAAHRLFCARDSAGVRPLHFHVLEHGVAFATRALDLLELPGVSTDLDGVALTRFLCGDLSDHERSMFADVRRLAPGHRLVAERGRVTVERYYDPATTVLPDETEWREEMRDRLRQAVTHRLGGAGATATLLSGGLDSATVTALAEHVSRCRPEGEPVMPFTVGFDVARLSDEREYARSLSSGLRCPVEEIIGDAMSPEGLDAQPVDHPTLLPLPYTGELLARAGRRGCRRMLTGLGGDALFDAARLQPVDHLRRGRWGRLLPWLRAAHEEGTSWPLVVRSTILRPLAPRAVQVLYDRWSRNGRRRHVPPWLRARAAEASRAAGPPPGLEIRYREAARQRLYEDQVGLAQQGPSIDYWSFHGARAGIEVSHPLLDERLAELVLAAPLDRLALPGRGQTKKLLRDAMTGYLPEKILRREDKVGWGSYLDHLYRVQLHEPLRQWFREPRLAELGLVDPEALSRDYAQYVRDGGTPSAVTAWSFPVHLERWLRTSAAGSSVVRFESSQQRWELIA